MRTNAFERYRSGHDRSTIDRVDRLNDGDVIGHTRATWMGLLVDGCNRQVTSSRIIGWRLQYAGCLAGPFDRRWRSRVHFFTKQKRNMDSRERMESNDTCLVPIGKTGRNSERHPLSIVQLSFWSDYAGCLFCSFRNDLTCNHFRLHDFCEKNAKFTFVHVCRTVPARSPPRDTLRSGVNATDLDRSHWTSRRARLAVFYPEHGLRGDHLWRQDGNIRRRFEFWELWRWVLRRSN